MPRQQRAREAQRDAVRFQGRHAKEARVPIDRQQQRRQETFAELVGRSSLSRQRVAHDVQQQLLELDEPNSKRIPVFPPVMPDRIPRNARPEQTPSRCTGPSNGAGLAAAGASDRAGSSPLSIEGGSRRTTPRAPALRLLFQTRVSACAPGSPRRARSSAAPVSPRSLRTRLRAAEIRALLGVQGPRALQLA